MEGVVSPLHQIGVDLRGGEVPQLTVVHEDTTFIDHLDLEVLEVVDDDEVAQIAGGNGTTVVQQEVPSGVVAGAFTATMGSAPREIAFLTM